jgi:hypothetical protein
LLAMVSSFSTLKESAKVFGAPDGFLLITFPWIDV